jgi:hypothetical protein
MSLLQDLLLEAADEVLQEAWDRKLLLAWRNTKYPLMWNVCRPFVIDNKITWRKFYGLKRTPRYEHQHKVTAPRFIAAYLPSLNDKLYDSKMSDDELVQWMNSVNLNTEMEMSDKHKVYAEGAQRYRSNLNVLAVALDHEQNRVNADAYNRNWSTIKSVRNKK